MIAPYMQSAMTTSGSSVAEVGVKIAGGKCGKLKSGKAETGEPRGYEET